MYEIKIIDNGYSQRFARIEFYYNFNGLIEYPLDTICANFIKNYLDDSVFSYCLFNQNSIRFHVDKEGKIRTNDIHWPNDEVTDTEKINKADVAIFDYLTKTFESLRIMFLVSDFISKANIEERISSAVLAQRISELSEK